MQKRDFETYQKRFRDFEILLKFSETYVFRGTIRHPYLNVSSCKLNNLISVSCLLPGGGGGVLPVVSNTAGKGYQFQASGIWKGSDFTCWSTRREICHSGGKKTKRAIKQIHFMAAKKSRKHSGFVIHSYFKDVTFTGRQNSKLL